MRAINNRKKPQVKKAANAKQGEDDQADAPVTTGGIGAQAPNPGDKKDQYDDKFYDLDDGWICDDDLGQNDDEVGEFIHETES